MHKKNNTLNKSYIIININQHNKFKLYTNESHSVKNVYLMLFIGIFLIKKQILMIVNIHIKYGKCYKVIYIKLFHW